MSFYLGQLFSLLSSACLAYSTFGKSKNRMILWQTVNASFYSASCLFLGGYSAVVSNILTIVRNILQIKGKMTKALAAAICVFMAALGLALNNRGVLGLLPITASVIYTVMMYTAKTTRQMNAAVAINMLQWGIFDCFIKAYPSLVMDIVIVSLSTINFFAKRKNT